MTETLPTALLSSLANFLAAQMGLHFPPNRTADLERGIRAAAKAFNFKSPEDCVEWLLSSSLTKLQIETLASQLTVGETYFFRDQQTFKALEQHIMPQLIQSHEGDRRLRIWSAGCATGEEPFSLAILVARMIPKLSEWNISIRGTDINPSFLRKASTAVYTPWSFRDCPAGVRGTYFKKIDERSWEIRPEIKKMVSFSYLNLVEDLYPSLLNETSALDLIFCRNVLMYFALTQAKQVIQRFHRCLHDRSWLVVSATEASSVLYSEFRTVSFPGAILYRKESEPSPSSVLSPCQGGEEGCPGLPTLPGSVAQPDSRDAITQAFRDVALPKMVAGPKQSLSPPPQSDPSVDYKEGPYTDAAAAAELTKKPNDMKSMVVLARSLANRGELTEALKWCDKAIAAERLDPAFHYLRATILQEQGASGEAASSLKRSLYLDHSFVLAHFALGNLHRLSGKYREAAKYFKNALSLLKAYRREDILPESEGITAGRLQEIISASGNSRGVRVG